MGRRESYSFTNFVAGEALGRLRGGGEIADEVESKAVQGQEENTEHPAVKVMHKTLVLLTRMFLKIVDIVGGLIVRLIKGNSNLSNFMEDVKGESGSKVDFWTWQDSKHGFSRSSTESDVVRLDGDVNDAFEFCREKGLLTLVYLTPVKSGDKNMAENIKTAAGGIAEFDVTGFAVYGARRGTVEGKLAERVLGKAGVKTTIKGVVIAVVAARFDRRTGRGGVKVLAQHHCDPPPGRGETKVWGKVVRKRFKGIVKGMRKEMEERVFERERSEGYERSRGEDERRVREEEEEVERVRAEEEERVRREVEIKERRVRLAAELPDEPEVGSEGAITVSVMHEGRREKRTWDKNKDCVEDVINWCDVVFEVDGGEWEVMKRGGGGVGGIEKWGKMTGLRLVKKVEEKEEE